MSLLLLWNGPSVPAPPEPPIGTIQAGGGGHLSSYFMRWEPVEDYDEPEAEPVAEDEPDRVVRRIGKPRRPVSPPAVEPWPEPPLVPEREPEPAIAAAIDAVLDLSAIPRFRRPRKSKRYWRPPVGQMPTRTTPVVMVTRHWGGLGLAMLMQRQGSDVVCAYDYTHVPAKDLAQTKKCGDGLVRKVTIDSAKRTLTGKGALWVFDGNDCPNDAEELRKAGEWVIGTSKLSQKLEDDRDFAAAFAEKAGFALPQTEKFTDYDQAITFLEANADRAFAYKPDKQDPTMTYVPLEKDGTKANEELREYLHSLSGGKPSFVLQEVVHGTEANFEVWLRDGEPVAAFCDLESKRKLVDDLGENIGCAGDLVFSLPVGSHGIRSTVGKYLDRPELKSYTGSVDVNVMYVGGKPLFLENCFRFGYNAYPVIFQALATRSMEDILRDWVGGSGRLEGSFKQGFGASLSLVCDHPQDGTPILVPNDCYEDVYLYRAYHDTDHVAMVEGWSELACVTAHAADMEGALGQCKDLAEDVAFPGKGYRTDLADSTIPTLPIPRYHALADLGLVPSVGDTDEEDALAAVLAVDDD